VKKSGSGGGSGGSNSGGVNKALPPTTTSNRTTDSPTLARRLAADPSEAIGTAVVKYNYQAQQPDELSLVKGTRILILEKSNDGYVKLTLKTYIIIGISRAIGFNKRPMSLRPG
jgi:SH3 domain.